MNISFNISKDQSSIGTGSSSRRLKPFEVYNVKFTGTEIKEGSKDGNPWKALYFNFENDEGTASVPIFYPKDSDGIRQEREMPNGGKKVMPSNWDNNWAIMKQIIEVLSDKAFEQFAEIVPKCKGDINKVFEYYSKIMNKLVGTETKVKFTGYVNNKGYTQLTFPKITTITDDGDCRIWDNFIGDKVALTDVDKKQAEKLDNKPTNMKDDTGLDLNSSSSIDNDDTEFDLASLD